MNGFKCYAVEWEAGTTYNSSPSGVKACLKDLVDKIIEDSDYNGWTYDETNCPDNEPILLKPTYGLHASFLKHTSSAKLMIALNYRGCDNYKYNSTLGTETTLDYGFLKNYLQKNNFANSSYVYTGGLFLAYIPESKNGYVSTNFNAQKSILDLSFYPKYCVDIISTSYCYHSGQSYANLCQSLIPVGTGDTSYSGSTYGAVAGSSCKYSILINDKAIIGASRYKTAPPVFIFCGEFLTNINESSDVLPSNKIFFARSTQTISYRSRLEADYYWYSTDRTESESYTTNYNGNYISAWPSCYYNYIQDSINNIRFLKPLMCCTNSLYKETCNKGNFDETKLRYIHYDFFIMGQKHNDGTWMSLCYLYGVMKNLNDEKNYPYDGYDSISYFPIVISWDKNSEFDPF